MTAALDRLKQKTIVVADTGDIDAIRQFQPIDATTNPSLLLKAANLPMYRPHCLKAIDWAIKEGRHFPELPTESLAAIALSVYIGSQISQVIEGRVSTEVDARLSFNTRATIERARLVIALYESQGVSRERVLIKIAATWAGIEAARVLERENIQTNLTLIFSETQAQACAEAGVYLISPFVGRVLDWHTARGASFADPADEPGVQMVQRIQRYFRQNKHRTIVMAASFRNIGEILALHDCDRLTISPALLAELTQSQDGFSFVKKVAWQPVAKPVTEAAFTLQQTLEPLWHEKLAEGIRLFINDQIALEQQLASQIAAFTEEA